MHRVHLFIITVVVIATHGLILLNDGLYWDDWLHYMRHESNDRTGFEREFLANGVPSEIYTQWGMRFLPFSLRFNYQITTFLSWLVIGLASYYVCYQSKLVSPFESLGIALFAVVYPTIEVTFMLSSLTEISAYALFILAACGYTHLQGSHWRRWLIRLGMLALFSWSFWISTLLFLYVGVMFLWWIQTKYHTNQTWQVALWHFLLRHADFMALPILFWIFKETVVPRTGSQEGYGQIKLNLNIFYNLYLYGVNGILNQFQEAAHLWLKQPLLLGLGVLFLLSLYPRLARWQAQTYHPKQSALGIFGFGLVIFFLAIFPYILIDRAYLNHHIDTIYGLLMGLPMGIILVGGLRLTLWDSSQAKMGFMLFYVLVVLFGVLTFQNYVSWQARWVKDESIMANLRQLPAAEYYSLYWIDDRFPLGPDVQYKYYEWANMFRLIWGGEERNAVYVGNLLITIPETVDRSFKDDFLSDWNPNGCQALLTIRPTDKPHAYRNELGLSLRYWGAKYLLPKNLTPYLEGLSTVEIRPLLAPQASDCPSQTAYDALHPDDPVFDPLVSHWTHMRRIQSVVEWERGAETLSPQLPYRYSLFHAFSLAEADPTEQDWFAEHHLDWTFYYHYQLASTVVPIEYVAETKTP